jgi:hypothetical protein
MSSFKPTKKTVAEWLAGSGREPLAVGKTMVLRKPRKAPRRHVNKAAWVVIGGQRFYARSKMEVHHAESLEVQRAAGLIRSWSYEGHSFYFPGRKVAPVTYRPDFQVVRFDGSTESHEVKGVWDRRSITKLRLMAKHHPDVKIVRIGPPITREDSERIEATRAKAIADREKAERKARKVGV